MPANFATLKNVANKHAEKKQDAKVIMTWLINVITSGSPNDGGPTTFQIPGVGNFFGWKFTLDPTSHQGSYTFGATRSIQLSLQRVISFFVSSTVFYISGRVLAYVQSTGQVFTASPKIVNGGGYDQTNFESETFIVPCDGIEPGKIDIYIEADQQPSPTLATESNQIVTATLFNYAMQALAAI